MNSTRQAAERLCGDCDRTGEFCVSFASGSALRRDRQGRPPINQRKTFLPIGEHVGERYAAHAALDLGRRELLTASSQFFVLVKKARLPKSRDDHNVISQSSRTVTRASSIRCLLSVQTQSPEGLHRRLFRDAGERWRQDGRRQRGPEPAAGSAAQPRLSRRMRLCRLYERRSTSTWNFYAVIGERSPTGARPRSDWPI
jgi:hypothetical protein